MNKKDLTLTNNSNNYILLKKYLKSPNKYNLIINTDNEEINNCITALNIKDKKERNEYIYNIICKVLDTKWQHCLPCNFCHNQCIASRNNYMAQKYDGCCYSFKRKRFGKVKKEKCQHLKANKNCDTMNISCKLFTCNYLKEHKIFSTSYDDYLLLKLFFNKKEKLIIKYNFFRTKEEILRKLNEKNKKPYLLYLISFDFLCK